MRQLIRFRLTRTPLQAFGFYCAYVLLVIVLAIILSAVAMWVFDLPSSQDDFFLGVRIGSVVAALSSLALMAEMIRAKKFRSLWYILPVLLSGVLGLFFGAIGGLIPLAYLSTVPAKE